MKFLLLAGIGAKGRGILALLKGSGDCQRIDLKPSAGPPSVLSVPNACP